MYQWVVWLHILAAIVWAGGMLFVALVLVPALRRLPREQRAALMACTGERFRTVGWVTLILLLVTGVWNLRNRGFTWSAILTGDVLSETSIFGRILTIKLLLVACVLAISGVHDFHIGPASTRAARADDPGRAERLRRLTSWLGRLNAVLALAIIWLAVALVRGLP